MFFHILNVSLGIFNLFGVLTYSFLLFIDCFLVLVRFPQVICVKFHFPIFWNASPWILLTSWSFLWYRAVNTWFLVNDALFCQSSSLSSLVCFCFFVYLPWYKDGTVGPLILWFSSVSDNPIFFLFPSFRLHFPMAKGYFFISFCLFFLLQKLRVWKIEPLGTHPFKLCLSL